MSTVANSLSMKLSLGWKVQQTNDNGIFKKTEQGPDSVSFNVSPDATTFTEVYADSFSLAASASQTVNFRSFTSLFLNTALVNTKLRGVVVKATATVTGGQLRITPGASNDLQWPLGGSTQTITLDVGTDGAAIALFSGTTVALSATDATWDISNPGSQTITVTIGALVGA